LGWFAQSGHGGAYPRDLRFSDPEYDGPVTGEGEWWQDTVGFDGIKGDLVTTSSYGCSVASAGNEELGIPLGQCRSMWRWQALQEFSYPVVFAAGQLSGKTVWQGYEWNVPGHEHCSVGAIAGQFPASANLGDADALAQFEYCFDRSDRDTSRGEDNDWSCETGYVDPVYGDLDAYIDPVSGKIPSTYGDEPGGHPNAVAAVTWLQANYPDSSYTVYAHIERDGVYDPDDNAGYNIEHFRDFNNAGPDVAFGFEAQPGHQAERNRGFGTSAFGGTKGGTGVYSADMGGLWDALLGEGRHWWFFASSDWHSRGSFLPFAAETTGDFWPGEYQKDYVYVQDDPAQNASEDIIDALRSGNSFAVDGDLIDRLYFVACYSATGECATMGQTLHVAPRQCRKGKRACDPGEIVVEIRVRDPVGANQCPYTFANPSFAQIGWTQPINEPVLDHVDVIGGDVTGLVAPDDPLYTVAVNPSTRIIETFDGSSWESLADGVKRMVLEIDAQDLEQSLYLRLRGTNLPPATPNESDADGNPLFDSLAGNIPCPDCPAHTGGVLNYDVEAWADLWFYSNPIFIERSKRGRPDRDHDDHDDDD
jgi:hypothetical protein